MKLVLSFLICLIGSFVSTRLIAGPHSSAGVSYSLPVVWSILCVLGLITIQKLKMSKIASTALGFIIGLIFGPISILASNFIADFMTGINDRSFLGQIYLLPNFTVATFILLFPVVCFFSFWVYFFVPMKQRT